ncbi:aldehyde dehydrogenase family protein [Longivirga aurantiaca]|uniref:Aldehyde dehydrogenase family protein n=1 Tax=Longivirga aurantiaca TaxID=1837743 RepID=A0ABW1SY34_9ACTN
MSQIVNPSNLEVIAEPTVTPVERIDEVVERATRAQRQWAGLPQRRRIEALRRLAELIRADAETLAQVETANVGKPIGDSRGEVAMVADTFDYYAGAIDKSFGDTIPVDGGLDFTVREPIGVVTVIAPWNFPLVIAAWNIAPALACGNAVIVKPAELTPLSVLELERIFAQVDLPDGLFQVVHGPGSTVGAALTEHPGVGKISFTGSTQTGQTIMRASAGTMKRLTLELGGKSAAVVFADADLERAASASTGAVFGNSGQDCCARSRVLVQRDVYDEFVALFVAATSTFTVGDPLDSTTAMGPLVSAPHLDKVRSFLDPALDIVAPVPGPSGPGHWMAPHLVLDPPREHRIVREEIFGPVVAVLPFDDEQDAIALANDTIFGLSGSIWTRDLGRAIRVARGLESGSISVNSSTSVRLQTPFGGFKQSGFGRELGMAAMDGYTELKNVFISTAE